MVARASLTLLFPTKQALWDLLVDEVADRQVVRRCVQCLLGGKGHSLPWALGLEHTRGRGRAGFSFGLCLRATLWLKANAFSQVTQCPGSGGKER